MLDYKSNIINNQSLMFPVKWWSFSIENMLLQKPSVIPTHFAVVRYQNKNHSIRIKTHLLFKSITSLAGPAPSCLDLTISIRPGWNYFLNKIKWFTLSDSTGHLSSPQSRQPRWCRLRHDQDLQRRLFCKEDVIDLGMLWQSGIRFFKENKSKSAN